MNALTLQKNATNGSRINSSKCCIIFILLKEFEQLNNLMHYIFHGKPNFPQRGREYLRMESGIPHSIVYYT